MAGEGTLFWFDAVEGNDAAREIIDLDANSFYRVEVESCKLLKVGVHTAPKVPGRLISLGRDPAHNDLILPQRVFSKRHCHFYFNKSSALILHDTSSAKSTQVEYPELDDDSIYRLQGDPRQRVLITKYQILMKIGPAQFRIKWRVPAKPSARQALEQAKTMFAQKQVAPELDLTFLNLQSLPSAAYEIRSFYTPSVASQYKKLPKITHEKLHILGSGTFGTVHKTVDLHTGDVWAVKTSNCGTHDRGYKGSLKREVEILAALSHVSVNAPYRSAFLMNKQPNIVTFIHSQGWTGGIPVEIFMTAHERTLIDLIPPRRCDHGQKQEPYFCTILVKHTLEAIAYLHRKDIIHQDLKPQNILYDHNGRDSSLSFYVSDFGLSKKQDTAASLLPAGTPVYMAPEVNRGKLGSNSDIWSFAVMMLLVLGYFYSEEPDLPPEEWRVRIALLPGYCSDHTFEVDRYPGVSLSSWKNQLRWYRRLRSLVQYKMVPQSLASLLAEDAEMRPNAQECLARFFPEEYK